MKTDIRRWRGLAMGLLVGLSAGAGIMHWSGVTGPAAAVDSHPAAENEPLYWVAPMDPDFRRDGPGKSPMGMDLVPVYAQPEDDTGLVKIRPEVENNLGVRTAVIARSSLDQTIRAAGFVDYDQDTLMTVHPRLEGWIENLSVSAVGDPVRAGERLYTLYSPDLVNAQEELQLAIAGNSKALLSAAEARLLALGLDPKTIEKLKKAKAVKQAIPFFASHTGVVHSLNVRQGAYVSRSTGLMTIAALDSVWVDAEVFARQAPAVSVGMAATVSVDYVPGRQWRGEVAYIYPQVDAGTRTLRLRIRLANTDGVLQPNMFARVVLHGDRAPAVLTVPLEAVIRTGGDSRVVKALGEGRFRSVVVTLGRVGDSLVEVLEGLEEGDRVVTSAQFLLDSESSKTAGLARMEGDAAPAAGNDAGASEHADHAHSHHGGHDDD